ncbi:hypothetical protein [Bacillus mycoides]|uniref:hypothetical protein n=1 Tax=Bacillus mycoides TaxID=1405 RepID=UPI0035583C04
MLDIPKPFFNLDNPKQIAILSVGILFLQCVINPFNLEELLALLLVYAISAFFILVIFYWFVGTPISTMLDKKFERRKEQIRKELEEIKKREYPILLENKPSFGYWEKQDNYARAWHKTLIEQYPQFDLLLKGRGAGGFSYTIDELQYVRYLLESGKAQTYDNAVSMMLDYFITKYERQTAGTSEYFEEKGPVRVYQKEREESTSEMYRKQRAAESDALQEEWLKEHYEKGQENLDREIRGQLEHAATHARQSGSDRQTVRHYDDQLGRGYHERLEEDRKYGYGEDDKISDVGGDLK